jgi:hypothetical protein
MILVEVIPKGCDLSNYCEFLFSYFLFAVGSFLGETDIWSRESKGKLWEGFFSSHFVPSFFFSFSFWLVFFGSSQSKANPSHTPSFPPFFSRMGGGGECICMNNKIKTLISMRPCRHSLALTSFGGLELLCQRDCFETAIVLPQEHSGASLLLFFFLC